MLDYKSSCEKFTLGFERNSHGNFLQSCGVLALILCSLWYNASVSVTLTLTLHNQLKVLSHTGCHSIPIGGYTGVGIRVIVPGVADDQVVTDKVDFSMSCWK